MKRISPILSIQNLTKRYRGIPGIDGVSLNVASGEIVGYLGPNGSGKSTTVKIITGILQPSGGNVFFEGKDIREDMTGFRASFGYVPDEAHVYTHLSSLEYLQLVGRLRGLEEKPLEVRATRLLELLGLQSWRHSPISVYSKGMKQRVLIAAALLGEYLRTQHRVINRGVDHVPLVFARSLNLHPRQLLVPRRMQLLPHGLEVPRGNLRLQVRASLIDADEGGAHTHLDLLAFARIELRPYTPLSLPVESIGLAMAKRLTKLDDEIPLEVRQREWAEMLVHAVWVIACDLVSRRCLAEKLPPARATLSQPET